MSTVPTVSDTKRAFYNHHARPITSVYRRVVEELMVEMHLLRVNGDFVYDPIYALGIVTTFDRFMDGYQPEADKASIFNALCQANEGSVEQYRQDAQALLDSVADLSLDDLKTVLLERSGDRAVPLKDALVSIAERHRFKYSRAFAIGLYTLVAQVSEELLKDKDKLMDLFRSVADSLSISFDKLQKDVELYRSNLDKMVQAKAVMADILAADRKKREERAQAQSASKSAQSAAGDSAKDAEAVATPSQDSSTDDSTTP